MTKDEFEALVAKFEDVRTIYGEDEAIVLERLNLWLGNNPGALSSEETKQLYVRVTNPPGAIRGREAPITADWEAEQVRRHWAESPEEPPAIDSRRIAHQCDGGTLDMDGELFEYRQCSAVWEIRTDDGPWVRAVPGSPEAGVAPPPSTVRGGRARSE